MQTINEIMGEMSKLRSKFDAARMNSDALREKESDKKNEISKRILDYWLANGGFEGRCFKAPDYCQDWVKWEGKSPFPHDIYEFIRIDKFLFSNHAAVSFCGRIFSLGEDFSVEHPFGSGVNQVVRISKLHPENLITKEEFAKAETEYQKRFDEYVDSLVSGKRNLEHIGDYWLPMEESNSI